MKPRKPRVHDSTAEFVYTVTCPIDAFWDIWDAVSDEIDRCLDNDWVHPDINDTIASVYSTNDPAVPADWGSAVFTNPNGDALIQYVDIWLEFLTDWYDSNQKKTNPEQDSDSR